MGGIDMNQSYRAELTCLFGDPADADLVGAMMEAGYRAQGLNYRYLTVNIKKAIWERPWMQYAFLE